MSKAMQFISDIGAPAMVGLVGVYGYIRQAVDGLPDDVTGHLLGPLGTLVLSLIVGYWLYRTNQKQREQIEKQHTDALADLRARLEAVTHERNDYLAELLEEREMNAGARPARRRPA